MWGSQELQLSGHGECPVLCDHVPRFWEASQGGTLLATSLGMPSVRGWLGESSVLEGGFDLCKAFCSSLDDVHSEASMHFWSLECIVDLMWAQRPAPPLSPCRSYEVATRFRGVSDR